MQKNIEIEPSLDMPPAIKVLLHNALMSNKFVTLKIYNSVICKARGFSFQI